MFGNIGWQEILLILIIVLILFGASRIPELMRAMGKGVKEFKKGMSDSEEEKEKEEKEKKEEKKQK